MCIHTLRKCLFARERVYVVCCFYLFWTHVVASATTRVCSAQDGRKGVYADRLPSFLQSALGFSQRSIPSTRTPMETHPCLVINIAGDFIK